MRKLIYMLALLLIANYANATIRTLNNNTPSPGQYTNWAAAQAASTAGDTIYVSGNNLVSYGNITVTQNNLKIIGTGYYPSGQNSNVAFFNSITVQVPLTTIDGIRASTITYDYASATGTLIIQHCQVGLIEVEDVPFSPELRLDKNVIGGTLNYAMHIKFGTGSSSYLSGDWNNNIFIGNIHFDNNGLSGNLIGNNIFKQTGSFYVIEGSFSLGTFTSNILVNYGGFSLAVTTANCLNNCIYAVNHPSFTNLPNDASTTIVGNPMFVNICIPCGNTFGGDYHLLPGSPCIGTGFFGTDMGVYGGVQGNYFAQRGEPFIAHVKQFSIPASSGNYGVAINASIVSWIKTNGAAATITKGEYFWNTDPGVGNGNAFTVSSPADSVTFTTSIQTNGARQFNNTLYIRTCSNTGRWSLTEAVPYYINPAIIAAEYFYDTDPGIGNATAISAFSPDDSININKAIATTGVSAGYHTFYVRTKDVSGVWSLSEGRVIYVQPQITDAEYFWDTDPGIGNAVGTYVFAATDSLSLSTPISTIGLKKGYHTLYVRTKDNFNKWSLSEGRVIYITSQITTCEYFWDTDPGIDNATKTSSFLPTDSLNFNPVITTNGLSKGYHTLYTRTKDSDGIWSLSEPRTIYIETQVTAAEYFWNTDPGQGNGTAMGSFAADDSVNFNATVSTSALRDGYNTLYTRTKDLHGNWALSEPRNIYMKPQILWGETFWDTDPGFANGLPIITGLPTDSFATTMTYSSTGMSRGLHFLYCRFQTTQHVWGLTEAAHIYVIKPLVAAEYYYDTDPGQGNGTSLTVTPGTTINFTGNITLPNLAAGVHKIYVRTKDSDGVWSLPDERIFTISPVVASTIVSAEFFVDNDPGVGNGTAIATGTPAASINVSPTITLPSLALGSHKIYIRTKDNRGVWSLQEGKSFVVANVASQIVAGEIYFDNDPGQGNGLGFPMAVPSATVSGQVGVTVPNLSPGLHRAYLRTKDNLGNWSHPEGRSIYINATQANATQITAAEYFVDNDPGIGNGTSIAIPTPASTVNVCSTLTLPTFAAGTHKLFIRTKDNNNVWSLQEPRTFTGIATTNVTISPGPVAAICGGGNVTLTANTTGGFNTYQWYNGCTLITGATNATYTTNTTGTYMVLVTNGANSQTAFVQVVVSPSPTVYNVSGGGSYCSVPGTGVTITVSGSELNTNYQLILNGTTNVTSLAGTGNVISFNNITVAGNYTVVATNSASCTSMMNLSASVSVIAATKWYRDLDNDGYGNLAQTTFDCAQPSGYIADSSDCNDNDASIHPGANEICGNAIDENCDGIIETAAPAQPSVISGAPLDVCPPANGITLSVINDPQATSYTWYAGPGTLGVTFNPASTTNVQVIDLATTTNSTYGIRVTASNSCGTSAYRSVSIRRAVSTPASVTGPSVVCANGTYAFSTAAVTGATSYLWSAPAGSLINGNPTPYSTPFNSVNITLPAGFSSGAIGVAAQVACFTSTVKTLSVSSATVAIGQITGSVTVCPGVAYNYSVPSAQGVASYAWTLPAGATGTSSTNSITIIYGGTVSSSNICVTATSVCGNVAAPRCTTVAPGLPARPASVTGPSNGVCSQTVGYTCPPQNAVTYSWAGPPGSVINSGQGTNGINITFPAFSDVPAKTVCVTATNSCGSSQPRCLTVRGAPNTPANITASPGTWCANTMGIQFDAVLTGVTGNYSLNWTYPPSPVSTYVLGGGNSGSLLLDWGSGNGVVSVTAANACGNGTRNVTFGNSCREDETLTEYAITVYPNPSHGNINIELTSTEIDRAFISVVDGQGRLVFVDNNELNSGSNKIELDLNHLAKGLYTISVKTKAGIKKVKLVMS